MTTRVIRSTELRVLNPQNQHGQSRDSYSQILFAAICVVAFFGCALGGRAQTPGIAETSYQGWSSFSQQTI
jgi:hypothetical protein